ncbi:marine proteobacterial sortase target protein [Alteromonadaceae bacterium M269]|nr:marine proteobacterial sortase target protein [Alteromonadaceae bacterium M269]
MQVLTYINTLLKTELLLLKLNTAIYFKTNRYCVSEYMLLIISSLFILVAFVPPAHATTDLSFYRFEGGSSQLKQGSLLLDTENEAFQLMSPVVKTDVDIRVTGMVGRVTITQQFRNPSTDWVNGTYVFPLPENAAVDHLKLKVGSREFEGQVHPKKKAKKIFQQAKKSGRKASLIEQERPNLFTNAIANIGPFETVEVTIEYQQLIQYNQGEFSLRFPSTLTPRYIPESLDSGFPLIKNRNSSSNSYRNEEWYGELSAHSVPISEALRITPPFKTQFEDENELVVQANIDTGFEVTQIQSSSHAIDILPTTASRFDVFLKQRAKADRDFMLSWRRQDESKPLVSHFTQVHQGQEYGMLMLLPPNISNDEQSVIPRDVTFILDISGSMQGQSIEQAKSSLIFGMETLTEKDNFNIIVFNSGAHAYWSSFQEASPENIIDARKFVRDLRAGGGTEMAKALSLAFQHIESSETSSLQSETRLRQLIFITDGSVGNEEQLMRLIDRNLGNSRLFTVGIGSAPNTYFMSEAAKTGRGHFTYINNINHVGEKMQHLFAQINQPVLSNIQLDFPSGVEAYPSKIPDLYAGQPLLISYKGNTLGYALTASGQLTKTHWSKSFPPAVSNLALKEYQEEPSGLNVLWARNKITQLTTDRRRASNSAEINKAIETTALTHHLVSEFTSLVAVDVTPSRPLNTVAIDKAVPNHLPAGSNTRQHASSLPQTATPAQLKLLIGLLLIVISICKLLTTHRR